jgi:lysophospholipase L1-like esterase
MTQYGDKQRKSKDCNYGNNKSGATIGIIGDSWLDYGKGNRGSPEQFFSEMLNSTLFVNAAKGGATLLGSKSRDISKQQLPSVPDILVLSGGGNDFMQCKGKKSCLKNTLDKIVSEQGTSGALIDVIDKWSTDDTMIFYMFTSELPFAPSHVKQIVKSGIIQDLASRLQNLQKNRDNVHIVDMASITDAQERALWTKDGYHFNPEGYDALAVEIKTHIPQNMIASFPGFLELPLEEIDADFFNSKIAGNTWTNFYIDLTMKIERDGRMTGEAPRGDFSGEWEFIECEGLCYRNFKFNGKDVPPTCDEIKRVGSKILVFFTERQPSGDPFILVP